MDRLSRAYSSRGVYFVGLNMDDTKGEVMSFLQKTPVSYPTVRIGNMHGETGKSYDVDGIPLTVILRTDGRIALVGLGFGGERQEKWLAGALDTLLAPHATPVYMIHKARR
jgi:hypothetical protein